MGNPTYNPTDRIAVKFAEAVGKNKLIGFDGALCGAGQAAIGVTEHDFNSGDEGSVVTAQTALLKIKAELLAGSLIASDSTGDGVLAVSGDIVNGILLGGCGTNDFSEIVLKTFKV